jgi:alanyl-tRNA synthetase
VGEEQLRAAEARTNEVVWEARPVAVRVVSRAEALALGVDPPKDAGEAVRLVEAEGFDLQPCGGTHPRSTAEVGMVLVLEKERYKGGSRIRFVCGHRALGAFRDQRVVLLRLGALLCAPLSGLVEAAQRALDALGESTRRSQDLLERALEGEARRLLAATDSPPRVVVAAYDGWPAADLRTLATRLVSLSPCVALVGSRTDKAHLVFAQSEGLPHDIPALLKDALATVGGRGGGRGNLAQGGGDRPHLLDEALARAAAAVRAQG